VILPQNQSGVARKPACRRTPNFLSDLRIGIEIAIGIGIAIGIDAPRSYVSMNRCAVNGFCRAQRGPDK